MNQPSNLRTRPDVVRFVDSARHYCGLIEGEVHDLSVWLEDLRVTLAELYAAAIRLAVPRLDPTVTFPEDAYQWTRDEWKTVFDRVARLLPDRRYYWCYFDPAEPINAGQTPSVGDLADDLADIYRDLKPGLRIWDDNVDAYLADIIFDWKEPLFASHWGQHAVDALRALHAIVYTL